MQNDGGQMVNNLISPQIPQPGQTNEEDAAMDEEIQCSDIPITSFKSNNIQKKERFIQLAGQLSPRGQVQIEAPLSPGASFAMRDNQFREASQKSYFKAAQQWGASSVGGQLSPRAEGAKAFVNHCVCGLPMREGQESCDQCEGKNSIHIEGMIIKKQKKEGQYRKYWYVLLGKELYSYKNQGDQRHKDMQSLAGVFIKSEKEEMMDDKTMMYPFMLIFPNKRRIYYLETKEQRD